MAVVLMAALSAPGTGLHAIQQNDLEAAGPDLDQLCIDQQRAANAQAIGMHKGGTINADISTGLTAFAKTCCLPCRRRHACWSR